MKVKKKTVLTILCSLLVVVGIGFFSFFVAAPTIHIAKKYDIPVYQLRVKSITLPHPILPSIQHPEDKETNYWFTALYWRFQYKDRSFLALFYKDIGFFDDFQLEEIEDWGVKYFQENIDKNIVAVELWIPSGTNNKEIYYNPLMKKEKLNENQIQEWFFQYSRYYTPTIYYRVNNLDNIDPQFEEHLKEKLFEHKHNMKLQNDKYYDYYRYENVYNIVFVDNNIEIKRYYNSHVGKTEAICSNIIFGMSEELLEKYPYQTKIKINETIEE